jgi:hypothetical protein
MLERFGQCGHSATPSVLPPQRCRQPSVSTHSNSWLLSRLHASTGRRGRASAPQRMQARPSSWASVRVAGNLPDGRGRLSRCAEAPTHLCHARRNPVACTAVDEFLAELEARMASATRASGVHPPLTAEALQVIAAADHGGTPMFTSANLARIAKENGVDVSSDMTPNDIIAELRRRQQPGS